MAATPESKHRPGPLTALGFDYGIKQIGVAIGQTLTHSARALTVFPARDGQPDWPQLLDFIAQWQADVLIVGLPLNMDGTEREFCLRARKFARRLRERSSMPVQMFDERLSTRTAKLDRAFEPTTTPGKRTPGKRPRKTALDADAARLILESWLAQPEFATSPDYA